MEDTTNSTMRMLENSLICICGKNRSSAKEFAIFLKDNLIIRPICNDPIRYTTK